MNRSFLSPGGAMTRPMMPKRSVLPDFGGRLFAAWLPATAPFATGRLAGSAVTDLSGGGHDLQLQGAAAPGAAFLSASPAAYATAPFSLEDVWEIANELTLISVARSVATTNFPTLGCLNSAANANNEEQYFALLQSPNSQIDAYNEPQQATRGASVSIPKGTGPDRDPALFEFNAASWSTKGGQAWRYRAGSTPMTATTFGRPAFGGRNGRLPAHVGAAATAADRAGYAGHGDIALAMVIAGCPSDMDGLYATIRAFLADVTGVAV